MVRTILSLILALCLCGCAPAGPAPTEPTLQGPFSATYLDVFDTVTTVMGLDESQEHFQENAQAIHQSLLHYHRLFDIYHDYDGINNLKTVNDQAGIAPVKVDEDVIRMLLDAKMLCEASGGRVNVTMGSVLKLWHDARTESLEDPEHAWIPRTEDLEAAAAHVGFDRVVIDEAESTVFLTDPQARLDVGAIAKGWSAERAAEAAPSGLMLSVGGNVRATGPKMPDGTPWSVGIQDPDDPSGYLQVVALTQGSMVTSGDYQRFYVADGKTYHHIIDPDTLMPADRWRSVTVSCPDSGIADGLSTALFTMSQEDGAQLLAKFDAQALWMSRDGSISCTEGFQALLK